MSEHGGLLGFLSEALDLQQQYGCSYDEALAIQRKLSAERFNEAEQAASTDNVIHVDFRKEV